MAGGMHDRGAYMAEGHAWQGGVPGGGMHGKGYAWQGACMAGGACMAWGCVAGKTAIAAGSTHPTGMHSCLSMHFLMLPK